MELKMKYQYTNFVYPYIVDEKKYKKYLGKLIRNKNCNIKFFEKEKDLELYKFFLPNIRRIMFNNFAFTKQKIEKLENMDNELKTTVLSQYPCVFFEYRIDKNIQGKIGEEDGIFFKIDSIQIICFKTGICFEIIKTHIEETENFEDVLDFNYKFSEINTKQNKLKDFEKIKIQTDSLESMEDIKKITESIIVTEGLTEKLDIDTERFFTYAYTCIDQEGWNDNKDFEEIKNEFDKYANIFPSNYNVRMESAKNYKISRLKFAKIGLTKTSSALLTSGIDVYNYTKLPYIYENQYFYAYILQLYKKIFLKKLAFKYRQKKGKEIRKEFVEFTKNLWSHEITNDEEGHNLISHWRKALELDRFYKSIKNKYDLIYKEAKIEKNEKINKVILFILIVSLIINIINFIYILK